MSFLAASWSDAVLSTYTNTGSYVDSTTNSILYNELFPLLQIVLGLLVCFTGYRYSRVLCFSIGLLVGILITYWLFTHQTNIIQPSIPIIVALLISTSVGVMFLLLHGLTVAGFVAHGLATYILLLDNNLLIHNTHSKILLHIILFIIITYYSARYQKQVTCIGCSMLGSELIILGIDIYTLNHGLTAITFQYTVLRYATHTQAAVPRCELSCKLLYVTWILLFILGSITQLLLRQLDLSIKKQQILSAGIDKQFTNTLQYNNTIQNESTRSKLHERIEGSLPHASFNYIDYKKLDNNLQGIYPIINNLFYQLMIQYGFQYDNVQNQIEHLLYLYNNNINRSYNDSITRIHNNLFNNYREWCDYLTIQQQICHKKADKTTSELKLAEIALYLLVWGESSVLRHTPELLCYIFHHLSLELRSLHQYSSNNSNSKHTIPRRQQGDFLSYVVTPLYNIIKNEKGTLEYKRHYDDINEIFWSQDCLNTYYADRRYDVNNINNNDDNIESSQSIYAGLPTISELLKTTTKTFIERRSWLHPLRSFYRIVVFYSVAFHILVCLAIQNYKNVSWWSQNTNQVLSSTVITLSGTSLIKELLDVWAMYGIINNKTSILVGFIIRLTIKSLFFLYLTLFYIWSFERAEFYYSWYIVIATIYVTPTILHILSNLFPRISTLSRSTRIPIINRILKLWYPMNNLFVGRSVHEREGLTYKYQLFWLSLLSLKLFLSYHFQVAPLIAPSVRILYIASEVPVIRRWQAVADTCVLFVLWIPFIMVYLFDAGIWFSVWQAAAGIIVGMMDRIGEIRSFNALISVFLSLPKQFDKKFINTYKNNTNVYSNSSSSNITPTGDEYPLAERVSSTNSNYSQRSSNGNGRHSNSITQRVKNTSEHILSSVFNSYQNANTTSTSYDSDNDDFTDSSSVDINSNRDKIDRFAAAWYVID